MTSSVFESVSLNDVVLQPAPIEPTWILDGNPVARSGKWSQSLDSSTTTWVWDCTAGRFNWYFDSDETIHIIEGEVVVRGESGDARTLRAGDAALFAAGTWAEWYVPTYVRKHAILRPHLPKTVWFTMRVLRKLKRTKSAGAFA
ncbi:cupin domain-containing protein [Actinomycetes bacterium M1A6_2h]